MVSVMPDPSSLDRCPYSSFSKLKRCRYQLVPLRLVLHMALPEPMNNGWREVGGDGDDQAAYQEVVGPHAAPVGEEVEGEVDAVDYPHRHRQHNLRVDGPVAGHAVHYADDPGEEAD